MRGDKEEKISVSGTYAQRGDAVLGFLCLDIAEHGVYRYGTCMLNLISQSYKQNSLFMPMVITTLSKCNIQCVSSYKQYVTLP